MDDSDQRSVGERVSWVHRVLPIRPGEGVDMLLCGGCFFFVLFGYALLKPVRDAMGVQRTMGDLRWLFVATCVISLMVSVGFGGIVSKFDRRRFISILFRIVIACLCGFAIVLWSGVSEQFKLYTGYMYFVWLSVVNLFLVSVFWGLMADTWTFEQGKRVFAGIGIGGTLGMLLGSSFVWWLANEVGPAVQVLIAAAMFEMATQLVGMIDRRSRRSEGVEGTGPCDYPDAGIGGRWWEGASAIVRSPYLLGIGVYMVMLAIGNTLIYFTKAELVSDASEELSTRIALFGQVEMWTQLSTLLVQLFVTAHLIKRLGVWFALAALPVVTLVGFVVLAWVSARPWIEGWQILGVLMGFQAIHSATKYAVVRPARETLFSVVSESEKYKAKPITDVFLYRGGDVAGAGVEKAIAAAGFGIAGIAFAAAPLAVFWGGLAIWLARVQRRKAVSVYPDPETTQTHTITQENSDGNTA